MVSPYLQRPLRSFEQALADRTRTVALWAPRGPEGQEECDPRTLDPVGVLVRLLGDPQPRRGGAAAEPLPESDDLRAA